MAYLIIMLPFFSLIVLNFLPAAARKKAAYPFCMAVVFIQMLLALYIPAGNFQSLNRLEYFLVFNLWLDQLGLVMIFAAALVAMAALITANQTFKNEGFNFSCLTLIALTGINGIALANDLFSLYVFIEVVSVASFIMMMVSRKKETYEGALKYLVMSTVAMALMLSAIALFLILSGDVTFSAVRAGVLQSSGSWLLKLALALYLAGLFIKGGLVPFHGWVADVYSSAPAPSSVMLAGITTKAGGIFILFRFIEAVIGYNANAAAILLFVGTLSIFAGAFLALGQNNLKRMLAYSSISQMGYIIVGLGAGGALGFFAALFHFFNHAVFKSQLFVNAAAIEEQTGTVEINKMEGLAGRMPVTASTFALAALSTSGVPPLSGFWSKLLIIIALWTAGQKFYAAAALLASIITLAYFLGVLKKLLLEKPLANFKDVKEAGGNLLLPAVVLSGITIWVGLVFPFIFEMWMK